MSNLYYLAGPMSNIPQYNYPAFDDAAARLRNLGYAIQSPAEMDSPGTRYRALASEDGKLVGGKLAGQTWGDFLSRDVKLIADECTGIILLPGWEQSKGARLECFIAINSGFPGYKWWPDYGTLVWTSSVELMNDIHEGVLADVTR